MPRASFARMLLTLTLSCSCVVPLLTGCRSAYYSAWEKMGWEKRDILSDRVEDARDSQEDAKKQFQTTLERFQEVTQFQGGKLEDKYKKLKSEYDRSQSRAETVTKRIASIETVANDMFKEWKQELEQYSSSDLRRSSQEKLDDTRRRYDDLLSAMRRAESRMKPVLTAFNDQVLFLKHNLNAAAIASLQDDVKSVESDVSGLINDMNTAINEANEFIKQMGAAEG